MSNRIAASRMTDRLPLHAWAPRSSRWDALRAWAHSALNPVAGADFTLSAHLRRDLGLAAVTAAPSLALDGEARRLGF